MRAAATALIATLLLPGCSNGPVRCDRPCLLSRTDEYVIALASRDPSRARIANDALLVENLERREFGQGLWREATRGNNGLSIHVPDELRQTAGWLGMMEKNGEPVMVALRLRFEDGEITEAEHLVAPITQVKRTRVQKQREAFTAAIGQGRQLDHERLIAIGASYFDALDKSDGTIAPFASDCERYENGLLKAGAGDVEQGPAAYPHDCEGQVSSNLFDYIDSIDNRRIFAADPVTGLVMGFSQFRHSMQFKPYQVKALDGSLVTFDRQRLKFDPFDLASAHVFKVGADARLHEIESLGLVAAYGSPTGWE